MALYGEPIEADLKELKKGRGRPKKDDTPVVSQNGINTVIADMAKIAYLMQLEYERVISSNAQQEVFIQQLHQETARLTAINAHQEVKSQHTATELKEAKGRLEVLEQKNRNLLEQVQELRQLKPAAKKLDMPGGVGVQDFNDFGAGDLSEDYDNGSSSHDPFLV